MRRPNCKTSILSPPRLPSIVSTPSNNVADTGLVPAALAVIFPNRPWDSPSGPAAKYSVLVSPAVEPLPKARPHKPGVTSGCPLELLNVPRKAPVSGLYALMCPSPKLPTSKSLLKSPKFAGASVMPHGEFNLPCETKRWTKSPSVEYTSIKPLPAPGHVVLLVGILLGIAHIELRH